MARFTYRARTKGGELKTGTVEARSADAAIESLQRAEFIVTDIQAAGGADIAATSITVPFLQGIKAKDIVVFSRQLATLLEAKVPITQSFKTLAEESDNPKIRQIIQAVLDDVSAGSALSQAFSRHPEMFSPFYVNLIRAAEESGKLEDIFSYLADHLERSYELSAKARHALIYPAFILTAFIIVIVVMLVVVIPRFTVLFEELGQEPPLYTRILIGFSGFLRQWGVLVLAALGAGVIGLWRWMQTPKGALWLDRLMIDIPIFGNLLRKMYLARFADNLSILIDAGVPIIRALEIAADVISNRVYKTIIMEARESVRAGNTISDALEPYREMPKLVTQMVRIGEESGRLDFILKRTAKYYRQEVDDLLENFVSLIEPILILVLGVGIAFLVIAVLVPLYNLSAAIS
ncbi:type II secretion system F family protein [Candidatus Parcubacteria bacterium]|nr:MAG: type II secretion system F family protein [Candidatus Parcubacteria bacterium]